MLRFGRVDPDRSQGAKDQVSDALPADATPIDAAVLSSIDDVIDLVVSKQSPDSKTGHYKNVPFGDTAALADAGIDPKEIPAKVTVGVSEYGDGKDCGYATTTEYQDDDGTRHRQIENFGPADQDYQARPWFIVPPEPIL